MQVASPWATLPFVKPDPFVIPWQGRQLRVRHDDPRMSLYSPQAARIRSAVELASDVAGLRLVLGTALGERYRVQVNEDGSVVALRRRQPQGRSRSESHPQCA